MHSFNFHHHQKDNSNGIYNLKLNEDIPDFGFSVGLHPKDIWEDWAIELEKIKKITQHTKCMAVGECGLDKRIDVDFQLQQKVFLAQISWANEIQKPLIIHCVRAYSEIITLKKKSKVAMVVHGFNKKKTVADMLLSHDFYLSFGKAVLQNVSLQGIVKTIPLEKIFLETDDEDFNMDALYQKVASLKSISLETLQQQIHENLEKIVG
jgi:TatD DNase family protein